ncbi:MAG TPA: histidine--tRNA ligase [Candidatus Nitrosocosmicus sp.]|nr:histidine--tRNA ligase [Candidatus Nitrosocosmicus sp.]
MKQINLNAQKGFRDLYPKDKTIQNYIFKKLRETASLFGFEEYDGPLVENINLYLEKSSKDLVENQTFQLTSRKEDEQLVLRPEMTPTLARMIASKENELIFPLKLFNLGLRYRYEAPQKCREREFYQADFDILGTNLSLADAEILNVVVNLFLSFGAKQEDFTVYINSRKYIEESMKKVGIVDKELQKEVINLIDKKDKLTTEKFTENISKLNLNKSQNDWINSLKISDLKDSYFFSELTEQLKILGIEKYIKFNPLIVRGLDYYTDLVFEVKSSDLNRSLLGGGRYDNLISYFGGKNNISGVGFATSDVVLWQFLLDKKLVPNLTPKTSKILVTIFAEDLIEESIKMTQYLRRLNIATELYLDPTKKLDKQLKYANQNNIPFVLILGPEEKEKGKVKIKDMKTGEQKEVKTDEITLLVSS